MKRRDALQTGAAAAAAAMITSNAAASSRENSYRTDSGVTINVRLRGHRGNRLSFNMLKCDLEYHDDYVLAKPKAVFFWRSFESELLDLFLAPQEFGIAGLLPIRNTPACPSPDDKFLSAVTRFSLERPGALYRSVDGVPSCREVRPVANLLVDEEICSYYDAAFRLTHGGPRQML